jgi:hypothetical protein
MIAPSAYILHVPPERREILLDADRASYDGSKTFVAEPVRTFDHSKSAPLIVFACFEDGSITHVADGRKGASAGTGLVRLNMWSVQSLARPVAFAELLRDAPARLRTHLQRVLAEGGKLPPKSLGALIDALLRIEPSLSLRLERFSQRRADFLTRLTDTERTNLAEQKETVTTALDLAGLPTDEVLKWSPGKNAQRFFLEGIPEVHLREDTMLVSDFADVPGFNAVKQLPFAARVFQSAPSVYPQVRLKIIMANRMGLEQQTGADLIYYNETFRSFVMVQYKAMEKGSEGPEFRWQPEDQLIEEVARMDELLGTLNALPQDGTPASFRLHSNPFFLKLCPRLIFNPDDKGLAKGMYLPLDFWKCLAKDASTQGPQGGRLITYANVGRRLTNAQFVSIVASAWIGTTVPQSVVLEKVVESVIRTQKTVTLAVRTEIPLPGDDVTDQDDLSSEDLLESE